MSHLKENNETYISHLLFSGKIGLTLVFRGVMFLLHALVPICKLPARWNLNATALKLEEWCDYAIKRTDK